MENKSCDFKWQIDRFDDIKILQYKVPGFDDLTPRQKLFVYYLGEAAKCGRDIIYDQNFRYNLIIRRTLEAVFVNYKGDRSTLEFAAFEKYLKKVWFANGIHHHYSGDKFVPGFTREWFLATIASIPENMLPKGLGGREELIAVITPVIFDVSLFPKRVNQQEGVDMVASSANNYYGDGITQAAAEEFYASLSSPGDKTPPSFGLNSKLVRESDGKLYEKVWKIGGGYSPAIEKIVYWLEKAADVAESDAQKRVIDLLVSYYRSGCLAEFDRYSIAWLGETSSQVDFINGFIEVYGDPLGYKASWESVVNFKNIEATKRTTLISDNAQWFEDNSPIDDKFKKEKVRGVSAKVITVSTLGGDCYPATPIGINLPNSDWIRAEHGSKSVTIENITDAYAAASRGDGFLEEFVLRTEDRERIEKYGSLADNLHTDLHECLGHGSGKLAPGMKGDELKNYASPLEEARADLFALYYIADPKMVELGLLPSPDAAKAEYAKYIMNGMMTQLTRIQPGKCVEQAHMRNRKMVSEWCYERGRAENVIEKIVMEGKTYVVVNDFNGLRMLFGELLREVQRIKSEGDFYAGKALIERYGVKVDSVLHREVLERYEALGLAPYSGFVNPTLEPVVKNGSIVDVTVSYAGDYAGQMLAYSEKYSYLPDIN